MYNIGLVIGAAEDAFSNQLSKGAMKAAEEAGDNLFIFPMKYLNRTEIARMDPCQEFEYQYNFLVAYALSHSLDAIILCLSTIAYRCNQEECMSFLRCFKDIPVLLVATDVEGYASIRYNNETGLRTGIEYLIKERNCKNICMLSGTKNNIDAAERLDIYLKVMEENGLTVTENMVEYSNMFNHSHDSFEKLIKNNPDMDGLVCLNDLTAHAAYDVLKKHNLKIGKDICVIGFDDIEDSMYMEPPLATVRAEASKLGYRAGCIIHDALMKQQITDVSFEITQEQALVETTFVCRTSATGKEIDAAKLSKDTELNYIRKIQNMKYINHQLNVVTRDMLMFEKGSIKNFSGFLEAFDLDGVNNCYLFLLEKPIVYHEAEYVNIMNNLYLQAYKEGNKIVELNKEDKMISKDELFSYEAFRQTGKNYIIIDIYSREMQYGILVCDLPLKYFDYIENICFLISLTTKISDLLVAKESLLKEQENMLSKLERDNLILSDISYKDELTGISNRRGFINKAMDILKDPENNQKLAVICYVDLNHLKLINDNYSHAEGNYALQVCAHILEQVAGKTGVAGRIGGDEFAIIKMISSAEEATQLKENMLRKLEHKNSTSGKPFEISMSMGIYDFTINPKSDIKELIQEADTRLYVDKKYKKPFIER